MSGLAVDASQPKPPLTPLTFVSIPSLTSLVFDRYPLGTSFGRSLDLTYSSMDDSYAKIGVLHDTPPGETCTLLSCQPEIDRFTTTMLVMEFSRGLATNPQSSLPSTSLVPTQVHKSLFQHATAVLDPLLDESLLMAVSWQVCFS